MLNSKLQIPFFFLIIVVLSCNQDKNKPYENVVITKTDRPVKIIPEMLSFPKKYKAVNQLYAEIDHSEISVEAWDKDSIWLDFQGSVKEQLEIDINIGNGQLILKEKLKAKRPETSSKWILKVPENFSVIIKSEKGDISLDGIKGTFEISAPISNVNISNCESSSKVVTQNGSIVMDNWIQRGRTKLTSASGSVKINSKANISYALDIHSGSDTVALILNGNQLNCNVEAIRFKGQGKLISNLEFGPIEAFYSDALEIYYDSQKINQNKNAPLLSISTGNGIIILNK